MNIKEKIINILTILILLILIIMPILSILNVIGIIDMPRWVFWTGFAIGAFDILASISIANHILNNSN